MGRLLERPPSLTLRVSLVICVARDICRTPPFLNTWISLRGALHIAGFNEFWLAVIALVPAEMPINVSIG